MKKTSMLVPSLLGGVLLGLLSSIPYISAINMFCCFWVLAGGFVAAFLYQKDGGTLKNGNGALVGFFAGLWGVVVSSVVTTLLWTVIGKKMQAQVYNQMMEMGNDIPPESLAMMENVFNNPAMMFGISLIAYLIINSIFATLGGLLGTAFLKGNEPQEPTGTSQNTEKISDEDHV